jgi:hypothetical protein
VIRMPLSSNKLKYITGNEEIVDSMEQLPARSPFHPSVVDYLNNVSKTLRENPDSKLYPDIATFAFWCRKASIEALKKGYPDYANRLGRGVAFHIAPSNVAVNFAYSLVVGLLAGNANIVRLPSKEFPQVEMICDAFRKASSNEMRPYVCLVKYDHDKDITDYLSGICDTRIIWGGDQTIEAIRTSPLSPLATEITFADRYSICIINADRYLEEENRKQVAQGFYNDTFLTDQNACTSPRLVVWIGSNAREAQDCFWSEFHDYARERYSLQPIQAVEKHSALCKLAATHDGVHLITGLDNLIVRVKVDQPEADLMDFRGNSGYFLEYEAKEIEEIMPLCTSKCQTLSYYGIDPNELKEFVMTSRPKGIDRIVPIGKTMDFALIWDGYDLIRSLSRELNII